MSTLIMYYGVCDLTKSMRTSIGQFYHCLPNIQHEYITGLTKRRQFALLEVEQEAKTLANVNILSICEL